MRVNYAFEMSGEKSYKMYYAENKGNIADKKKTNYQKGLGKSHADSAKTKPQKLQTRPRRVVLTVFHEAAIGP